MTTPSTESLTMRRADDGVLTPREREAIERQLHVLVQVQETVRSFEDGELNLRDAIGRMAFWCCGPYARRDA